MRCVSNKRTVGVIGGAGFWGVRYLKEFAAHPDCDLVSVADTAIERREHYARRFDIPGQYDTGAAMLEAEKPDIVSVVLPVGISYDAAMACLSAGVSVVTCEKPISESLANADRMVEAARNADIPLFCGTALWEISHFESIISWICDGNLGELMSASIPSGFNEQVSGNGCVLLCFLRFITGREVEWVEGYTDPPDAAYGDGDCNVYGRMGLNGDVPCLIVERSGSNAAGECVFAQFENGMVWLTRRGAILVEGTGDRARPVYPDFLSKPVDLAGERIRSYLDACQNRGEARCSAHDYRQALEIAIAMKISAREGHRRIALPLSNRDQRLNPHPYRMLGGDVVGWESIGLRPPSLTD
jgi:predicted dehydrogenase